MFTAHLYARVRLFLRTFAHETAGAARTRHSLLPLFLEEGQRIGKAGAKHAARTQMLVISGARVARADGAQLRPCKSITTGRHWFKENHTILQAHNRHDVSIPGPRQEARPGMTTEVV